MRVAEPIPTSNSFLESVARTLGARHPLVPATLPYMLAYEKIATGVLGSSDGALLSNAMLRSIPEYVVESAHGS